MLLRNAAVVFAAALFALLAAFAVASVGPDRAGAASGSYIDFDEHDNNKQLAAGVESGVVVRDGAVRLASGRTTGILTSRKYYPGRKDTFNPSWNAYTPSGTWMRVEMRVRSGGSWTRWWNMGLWASGTDTIRRQSVKGQSAGNWQVLSDTLQSKGRLFADSYQYRLTLNTKNPRVSPTVRSLFMTSSNSYRHGEDLGAPPLKRTWGKTLGVPARSQMIYPNGGPVWCSPTSLSMMMSYWANRTGNWNLNRTVPTVARGVYDPNADPANYGNWPFNTAYASSSGLEAKVGRFNSIKQVERWIDIGVPVVVSIAWDNRSGSNSGTYLGGAALSWSGGHLLVIKGFTRSGDVVVNDPAASSNARVSRVYDRAQLSRAWLRNGSGGVVYLVHPTSMSDPVSYAAAGSW